jgi:hypothetical protein
MKIWIVNIDNKLAPGNIFVQLSLPAMGRAFRRRDSTGG